MQLHTPKTYSLATSGPVPSYPSLTIDADTEVLVLGAGISGAFTAWRLQQAGVSCMVIDRGAPGTGSTGASTSLLQYEIDKSLCELARQVGAPRAEAAYRLCYQALDKLEGWCREVGDEGLFDPRHSLQFASRKEDVAKLEEECAYRKRLGFDVTMLGASELALKFQIKREAGLFSAKGAQVDAFKLTHKMLAALEKGGGRVFGHTDAFTIERNTNGVVVHTAAGQCIRARHLVVACGYESQRYLPKPVEELSVTYALVTDPVPEELLWYKQSLIWETARPYTYLRTTTDSRVLIGGKDDPYDGQPGFPRCSEKANEIYSDLKNLFPHLTTNIAYSWAGLFGNTVDSLPLIGGLREQPNTLYALGFGGNGILFSVLAAEIVTGLITKGAHPDASLFSFDRL